MTDIIETKPRYLRADIATGAGIVDHTGGDYGAGVIQGVSVTMRGPALGHGAWLDADFVSDVTAAINAKQTGLKARYTHPGLSGDGLGTQLGKLKNAQTIGEKTVADLHIIESARATPDGDLGAYVMQLASEVPDDFGLSIAFQSDEVREREHLRENTQGGRFVSPDEDNADNLPHFVLGSLRAGDVVDEPAANPEGLFLRSQELPQDGEAILDYALGLTDAKPEMRALNADPDRIAGFVQRYLSRHKLEVRKAGDPVAETTETAAVETPPSRDELKAELRKELSTFTDAFGAENGTTWFNENLSFTEGLMNHVEVLSTALSARDEKIDELEAKLAALDLGETEAAEFSDGEPTNGKAKDLVDAFQRRSSLSASN